MTIIPAGTLRTAPSIRPAANIMFGSGAPWYVSASELPTHETYPPRR
jgi:hypothetical protein